MKARFVIKTLISLLAGCFVVGVTAAIATAGNDFVVGNLQSPSAGTMGAGPPSWTRLRASGKTRPQKRNACSTVRQGL